MKIAAVRWNEFVAPIKLGCRANQRDRSPLAYGPIQDRGHLYSHYRLVPDCEYCGASSPDARPDAVEALGKSHGRFKSYPAADRATRTMNNMPSLWQHRSRAFGAYYKIEKRLSLTLADNKSAKGAMVTA